jgi:ribosomal protein L40E
MGTMTNAAPPVDSANCQTWRSTACRHCHHAEELHYGGVCHGCGENRACFEKFPKRFDPHLATFCPGFEAAAPACPPHRWLCLRSTPTTPAVCRRCGARTIFEPLRFDWVEHDTGGLSRRMQPITLQRHDVPITESLAR